MIWLRDYTVVTIQFKSGCSESSKERCHTPSPIFSVVIKNEESSLNVSGNELILKTMLLYLFCKKK